MVEFLERIFGKKSDDQITAERQAAAAEVRQLEQRLKEIPHEIRQNPFDEARCNALDLEEREATRKKRVLEAKLAHLAAEERRRSNEAEEKAAIASCQGASDVLRKAIEEARTSFRRWKSAQTGLQTTCSAIAGAYRDVARRGRLADVPDPADVEHWLREAAKLVDGITFTQLPRPEGPKEGETREVIGDGPRRREVFRGGTWQPLPGTFRQS